MDQIKGAIHRKQEFKHISFIFLLKKEKENGKKLSVEKASAM